MSLIELFIIAIGLSMDAFAVSIGKGLSICTINSRHTLSVGLWFGGFQALMPLIGYLLGYSFASVVSSFDHWIAFFLLGIIGWNMIKESLSKDKKDAAPDFSFKTMLVMAIATSIDALAIGITFAFLNVEIISAAVIIGITTFLFSAIGLKIGNVFGCRYKSKAEFTGGLILILIGGKILVEHTLI